MNPQIEIAVRGEGWGDEAALAALAHKAFAAAASAAQLRFPDRAELSLLFTGDAEMREINRDWRGQDKPTNVLSFPGQDVAPGEEAGPLLGDIVIARETVEREAALDGKLFDDHLTHLIVHGIFHLFGYDHVEDEDAEAMEDAERRALELLGIDDPYAE